MLDPKFVIFGAILNLIGSSSYVVATVKGTTKPNRVTWFLWALIPIIAFSAQLSEGVGLQALMTFMVGFGPALVFVASFMNRKSVWNLTNFDFMCGGLSVLGLVLWLVTKEGNLAIALSIAADGLAALPTVRKAYRAPETESAYVYLLAMISAVITLLTIDKWNFAYWGFPAYILAICGILFALIHLRPQRQSRKGQSDILPA
jgi:hypothetical protein